MSKVRKFSYSLLHEPIFAFFLHSQPIIAMLSEYTVRSDEVNISNQSRAV
jgi:hypothetical protein